MSQSLSSKFGGSLNPENIREAIKEYGGIRTTTIQSAFKYDYDMKDVSNAVDFLNNSNPGKPVEVDEKKCISIIEKLIPSYQKQVKLLEPSIKEMAQYVPSRRKRKLHIGLFGYSRNVSGVQLPRAITVCASLYSYGLPPEILGLDSLTSNEIDYIRDIYSNFDADLKDSLKYLNEENLKTLPKEISGFIKEASRIVDYEEDASHKKITSIIIDNLKKKDYKLLSENIVRAGFIRGFLG